MRRFCNYFMITYNIKRIQPFLQFINEKEFELVKNKVLAKMEEFFLKPITVGKIEQEESNAEEKMDSPYLNQNDRLAIRPMTELSELKILSMTI